MKGTIWTVAIVVILAAVMFVGVSAQYDDSLATESVVAEEHTLSDSEAVTLEMADDWDNMIADSEIVRTTEDEELVRGDDYTIDYDTGEILGEQHTDGEEVRVTYQYDIRDDQTQAIAAVVGPLEPLIAWFVLIAGLGTLLAWIGLLPKGGGSW